MKINQTACCYQQQILQVTSFFSVSMNDKMQFKIIETKIVSLIHTQLRLLNVLFIGNSNFERSKKKSEY